MADAPRPEPTFQRDPASEGYLCLIPDAGQASGQCGYKAPTLPILRQHMQQRHAGQMVDAEDGPCEEEGEDGEAPEQLPTEEPGAPVTPAHEPGQLPTETPEAPGQLPTETPEAPEQLPTETPEAPSHVPAEEPAPAPHHRAGLAQSLA